MVLRKFIFNHSTLGSEYEKVVHQASQFKEDFELLKIGKPLLFSEEDYGNVANILVKEYNNNGVNGATILMGHGSQHYAFTAYAALDHMLTDESVYIGCVESYPPVELLERMICVRMKKDHGNTSLQKKDTKWRHT